MKGVPLPIVLTYARQLWRHRWLSLLLAWMVCLIGWPIVSLIPPRYESSARVYLNADQLLTPILSGLAINDNPMRNLEYLQRTLLSRPNLEQVIHLSDLDLAAGRKTGVGQREELLHKLAQDVSIRSQTANLITIAYSNRDPVIAKNVVSALLTVFSENATGSNRTEMENAKRFLNQQIQAYESQLRAAEERRAEFHRKYMELLPGLNGAVSQLEAGRARIAQLKLELADMQAKRDSLMREAQSVPKVLSIDAAGPQVIVAGQPVGARARLEEARTRLDALRTRFTDLHPDVIAVRKQIAELEEQVAREAARPSTSDTPQARKSDIANPLYDQVKIRLVEAETALASMERALKQAQAEQATLEKKAQETPGVEAQAKDLDRDYAAKKKSYEELLQRREQTLIAEAADTTADKIQFRVIDAPQVPILPHSPKQPLLLLGVLVAAIGAAIAVPLLLMQFDRSFATVAVLRQLGRPVLGSVTRIGFPGARRRVRLQIATLCAGTSALVIVFAVLFAFSVKTFGLGLA
jgi:polysaccharide chain length determinant protein (PEP-CTERM system associated)